MNSAVVQIKFLTLFLGALMLAVDITLFSFVEYNMFHLHMYEPEAEVRSAHIAAEVTTVLNCLMCFADCYVICFERAHSKKHVKALIYATVSVCIFMGNVVAYHFISNGRYKYTIPTMNITAFNPANMKDVWFDEIHAYLVEYETSRDATKTKAKAPRILKTLSYFQELSSCCGVISYADYTTLGVPVPQTCECSSKFKRILHDCTRGKRLTGGRSFEGGVIDMTEWRRRMGAGSPPSSQKAKEKSVDYELKKEVHKDGCEEHRTRYVYVLTGVLRLLVTSNSLQFLSIIMIPIPWLYEK